MTTETTLNEALETYMLTLEEAGKNPRTLYTYGKDREQIQAFFGADCLVSDLHKTRIGKFLKSDALLKLANGQDRAKPTVYKTICFFKRFVLWCVERGWISENPLPKTLSKA